MKINYLFSIVVMFLLASLGCQSLSNKAKDLQPTLEIEAKINQTIEVKNLNREKILEDIQTFKNILKTKKKLSASDQQLHQSLLEAYIQIKYRPQQGQLLVPPRTKVKIPLASYCLDSGKAIPEENEVYRWRKQADLYIPEILKLSADKKFSQELLQELIWNLDNKTYWENYPSNLKNILLQIDPKASEKLPSQATGEIKSLIQDQVQNHIPEAATEVLDLVKGRYYELQDFKKRLESINPKKI